MNSIKSEKAGYIIIIVAAITSVLVLSILDPIAQDIKYHNFSDKREIFGILNFWNVISNVPFLIVGIYGLVKLSVVNGLIINQ